jgi:processive 1,2-diacylglycerol beta-glucosyltransferase
VIAMRALIFTVSTGAGHSQTADALKKYILLNEPDSQVEIVDTFKYINKLIDKVVVGSYGSLIKRTPVFYGKMYDYTETDNTITAVSNKLDILFSYKILTLINELMPDIIITTHYAPAEMLSILKLKNKIDIPVVTIMTDYASHNFWLYKGIDAYIVSNSDMIEEMVSKGIDRNSIYDFGIPVNPNFLTNFSKNTTLSELGLRDDLRTILVMCGSLGVGHIIEIYEELNKIDLPLQIIILTGSNKKLYAQLNEIKDQSEKEIRIIPFTKEVNKYMQACDLLLTKPGGITITEALLCGIPLALFLPFAGQEKRNLEFLIKHNLAIHIKKLDKCKNTIEDLLLNPTVLESISRNHHIFAKPLSGINIFNLLKKYIKAYDKNPIN